MWKPGQLVTLWGKVYRITKCSEQERYRVCCFCATKNYIPCRYAYNYPEEKGFNHKICRMYMPKGCYPKKLGT